MNKSIIRKIAVMLLMSMLVIPQITLDAEAASETCDPIRQSVSDNFSVAVKTEGNITADVSKGTRADKAAAKQAVEEFLEDHEKDGSGEFAYDRYADPDIKIESVKIIEPYLKNTANGVSIEEDSTIDISLDSSEKKVKSGYLKNELIKIDEDGNTEIVERNGSGRADISVEGGTSVRYLAAAVLYSEGTPDPVELASQNKAREIIANYADVEYYKQNSFDNSMTTAQKQALEAVAREATQGCTTDYEKIRAVYSFVAENIFYDTNDRYGSPYAVWTRKKGVCADYASLSEYLLDKSGIACMTISGHSPTVGDDVGHDYNAAYDSQNRRWIYFDATWGSRASYGKGNWITIYQRDSGYEYVSSPTWFRVEGCDYDEFDMSAEYAASIDYHAIRNQIALTDGTANYSLNIPKGIWEGGGASWRDMSGWKVSVSSLINRSISDWYIKDNICNIPVTDIGYLGLQSLTDSDALTNIIVPASVTSIYGFSCSKKLNIVLKGNPPASNEAFNNMKYGSTITYSCNNPNWTDSVINTYIRSTGTKFIKGHSMSSPVIVKQATDTEDGYKESTCSICGEVTREVIPKTGTQVTPPTDEDDENEEEDPADEVSDDDETFEGLLDNPIKLSSKTKKIKYKTIKKKSVTIKPIIVKNAKGKITYSVEKGDKKILKLNSKTGKITVKKGTKKGTYSLIVQVSASGEYPYDDGYEYIKVKVKIVK